MIFLNKMEKELTQEDKKFFLGLETKCHSVKKCKFTPNVEGEPFNVGVDDYNEIKLTKNEIEKILVIVSRYNNIIFMPIQGAFGFHPAYAVVKISDSYPGVQGERKFLLQFDNNQLPEFYNFNRFKQIFGNLENLRRAELAGIKFSTEEASYLY